MAEDSESLDRVKRQVLLTEMARYEDWLRYRSESTSSRAALLVAAAAIGSGVAANALDSPSTWALLLALAAAAVGVVLLIPVDRAPAMKALPPREVVELAQGSSYAEFVDDLLARRVDLYERRLKSARLRARTLGIGFALFGVAILVQVIGYWLAPR